MTSSKARSRKLTAKQKSAEAVRLYHLGWSYDQIAVKVGYRDRSGAYRAVERAIAETIREPAEHVRRAEIARLDMVLRAAFEVLYRDHYVVNAGKVVHHVTEYARDEVGNFLLDDDGHPVAARLEVLRDDKPKLEAIDRVLKIMNRRARLMGLDAPTQFEAVHPDLVTEEMNRLAAELGMSGEDIAAFDAQAKALIEQHAAEHDD